MTWPPEGSAPKPPNPKPQPATPPTPEGKPRAARPEPNPFTPPQFLTTGIDPYRALLLLSLPVVVLLLVWLVVVSPLVGLVTAGVVAAVLVVLVAWRLVQRRRRGPGVRRPRPLGHGRPSGGPLGNLLRRGAGGPGGLLNRLRASRPGGAGRPAGGSPRRLLAKARSVLPRALGGTKPSRTSRPGGAAGGPGGKKPGVLSKLRGLMPGGRDRPASGGSGRPGSRPGGSSRPGGKGSPQSASGGGAKRKPGGKPGRLSRLTGALGRGGKTLGKALMPGRPRSTSSRSKPPKSKHRDGTGGGKNTSPSGGKGRGRKRKSRLRRTVSAMTAGVSAVSGGVAAVAKVKWWQVATAPFRKPPEKPVKTKPYKVDAFGKQRKRDRDPEFERLFDDIDVTGRPAWPTDDQDPAPAKKPPPEPEWPTDDRDQEPVKKPPPEPLEWHIDGDVFTGTVRDHDISPSPSPPSHREAPRITSTNNGGSTMAVSPTKYNDLITNATSRTQGWQAAADAFRRDSESLNEKAKEHDGAADVFEKTGNLAAAEDRRDDARKLRDDANSCLTFAAKMQEKANNESTSAA